LRAGVELATVTDLPLGNFRRLGGPAEEDFMHANRSSTIRRAIAATFCVLVAAPAAAEAAPPPRGALIQLPAPSGCIKEAGGLGCAVGIGLDGARGIVATPDGKNVYVASVAANAVTAFVRDPGSGAIAQLAAPAGCVRGVPAAGCSAGLALGGVIALAASPDGAFIYAAGSTDNSIAVLRRDPATGALAQVVAPATPCVRDGGQGCTPARALKRPVGLVISPDGRFLYAAANESDSIAVFARDVATGSLTQLAGYFGCVKNGPSGTCANGRALDGPAALALSDDGASLVVASSTSDAIAIFARDAVTGGLTQLSGKEGCIQDTGALGCKNALALDGPNGVVFSHDGKHVYVTARESNAVAAFARDATGRVSQLPDFRACVRVGGGQGCSTANALIEPLAVAMGSDDGSVYVAGAGGDAIVVLARDGVTGGLAQLAGTAGCLRNGPGNTVCAPATALDQPIGLAVAPDGRTVYATAATSDSVGAYVRQAAPICTNLSVTVPVAVATRIRLECGDPNGDPVVAREVSVAPVNGSLGPVDQVSGTVLYTAKPGFVGADTFVYAGSDGASPGVGATITIKVTRAGTGPLATVKGVSAQLSTGRRFRVRIGCPSSAVGGCRGPVTLRAEGRPRLVISRRAVNVPAGRTVSIWFTVAAPARSYVQARTRVTLRVLAVMRDRYGNTHNDARTLLLLARR